MNKNLENLEYIFEKLIETTQNLEKSHELLKQKISYLEDKLDNNRKYLENILNSITNGVCTIDTQTNISLLNPAAKKIINVDNYQGQTLKDLFSIEANSVDEVLNYCKLSEVHDIVNGSKQHIKLKINASYVYDKEKVIGAVLVFEDITKLEALKLENKQKEKLATLGQIAASIAHDIRNPLASIQLFVSLLEDDDVEDKKEIIKNINTNIQRIDEIVTNTLLIAKKVITKKELIKLNEMVDQIEKEIINKLISYNVLFKKNIQPAIITSDRNLLRSIITNLLTNAIEAAKTTVELMVRIFNNILIIIVKDDGCVLNDKNMIFEPFFSEKQSGVGLGLFIVKKAIEALNGKITVLSAKKTIFIVCINV
ncbi:integral membrane sensor signal transduction histidine kinase [Desulfurella amilsii]|uniref:histidine kinase n=1 Tax=Desulfurella amilsii TaxID=1562698 RepID=A0A1X4XYE8_9BACT|nr:ATP-binding protein [Desulfurella amilsii]OSS42561.1 integral membrane sensor signal transduction histidine kinase [Desulfurella amilsii]